MEEKIICTDCGCIIEQGDEVYEVNGEVICECCANDTIVCDYCGNRVWEDDSVSDDDIFLCCHCYEAHYHRCSCCERIIRDYNTNLYNELPYCDNCIEDMEDNSDEIEEYNYKPEPVFKGKGNMYFGVELEVDEGGKSGDNACRIKDIANMHTENIYIKADGSLEDGFEIVSHPMTLNYHMYDMDWESVMHEAVNLGYRSHKSNTCGLHIHVNRDAFGSNQSEQEEIISRILFFVEKHWNEIFKFSRRSEYNMNRWSCRYGMEKSGKEILDKAKDSGNRYVAVNLKNYHTIEFRLFRGTLKYNTFIATLQLVSEICKVALLLTEEEIDKLSWSDFVRDMEYHEELVQYLKERQLYVNEEVFAEEDI